MFVLGGGAFASDLIVNCENNHVRWHTDEKIPGASQEQNRMRENGNRGQAIINMEEIERRVEAAPKKKVTYPNSRR